MHIAILGNGIAGITAARFIRKLSDHRISVISGESDYFFSRTALMYIYMGHMRQVDTQPYEPWFWEKNRIDLIKGWVERIDPEAKLLHFPERAPLAYDRLLLATGSQYNKYGWPGQDLEGVRGLISLQDLAYMERHSEGLDRAVIVGGGLIGIEMAEMFRSRHIRVTMLVREQQYWDNVLPVEEASLVSRHIREHGIDLRLGTELKEIVDDGHGRACGVVSSRGDRIDCGFVGLTAGVHPRIQLARGTGLETNRGFLVNPFLETSIPGIFAAGDCAELRDPRPGRKAVEPVWYAGRIMGETAAYNLCSEPVPYDPGIWFNSAKFLDIEYQVYGDVPPRLPDHYDSLYWEHPDGKISIRLVYERETHTLRGFNLMGVRYRQEVCERWIEEGAGLEEVLAHLPLANFDPEFYKAHEAEVIDLYNRKHGKNLRLESRRGLSAVIRHLRSSLTGSRKGKPAKPR